MKTIYVAMIAMALPLAAAQMSFAQCGCGADVGCGAAAGCGAAGHGGGCGGCKVCRLVKKEVEVEAECYGVKCKDICVPGCGSKCVNIDCVHCDGNGCDSCCDCKGCDRGALCKIRYPAGTPGKCARMKTVKELKKYITKKKVCVYKWEVVDAGCCDGGCDAGCGCGVAGCGCAG